MAFYSAPYPIYPELFEPGLYLQFPNFRMPSLDSKNFCPHNVSSWTSFTPRGSHPASLGFLPDPFVPHLPPPAVFLQPFPPTIHVVPPALLVVSQAHLVVPPAPLCCFSSSLGYSSIFNNGKFFRNTLL